MLIRRGFIQHLLWQANNILETNIGFMYCTSRSAGTNIANTHLRSKYSLKIDVDDEAVSFGMHTSPFI